MAQASLSRLDQGTECETQVNLRMWQAKVYSPLLPSRSFQFPIQSSSHLHVLSFLVLLITPGVLLVLPIWGYPPGLKQSTNSYVLKQNDSMSPSLNQLPVSPLTGLEPLGPISICTGILTVFILDRCWKGTCSCCELMHATAMSCLETNTSQHFPPFASTYILFLPFLQCFLSLRWWEGDINDPPRAQCLVYTLHSDQLQISVLAITHIKHPI